MKPPAPPGPGPKPTLLSRVLLVLFMLRVPIGIVIIWLLWSAS